MVAEIARFHPNPEERWVWGARQERPARGARGTRRITVVARGDRKHVLKQRDAEVAALCDQMNTERSLNEDAGDQVCRSDKNHSEDSGSSLRVSRLIAFWRSPSRASDLIDQEHFCQLPESGWAKTLKRLQVPRT